MSVNTKYSSSRELKTSEFSLVLRTHENSDVSNTLGEIYLVGSPQKSKYPLCIHIISDQIYVGVVKCHFSQICSIFVQYLDIETKFCIYIIDDKIYVGDCKVSFSQIRNIVTALD